MAVHTFSTPSLTKKAHKETLFKITLVFQTKFLSDTKYVHLIKSNFEYEFHFLPIFSNESVKVITQSFL